MNLRLLSISMTYVALLILAADSFGGAGEDDQEILPQPHCVDIRVSSIVEVSDDKIIGLVARESGASALLREDQEFLGYRIIEINVDDQAVRLACGETIYVLGLRGADTVLLASTNVNQSVGSQHLVSTTSEVEEAVSKEDFIRAHYWLAGMSSPDDPIPEAYLTPVSKEDALARMAESVGLPIPQESSGPVTREEFMRNSNR